jgi:N-acetylmuramoyl-L-alanine amidase
MRIILDPGHGGRDPGAVANGYREADLVWLIGRGVKWVLNQHGHTVLWTRMEDQHRTIAQRTRWARLVGGDMLLSLHANAGPPSASGVEAWTVTGDQRSRILAASLLDTLVRRVPEPLRNRGVRDDTSNRHGSLGILRGTYRHMPAVLLECGFVTSKYDIRILASREYRVVLGESVLDVVTRLGGTW